VSLPARRARSRAALDISAAAQPPSLFFDVSCCSYGHVGFLHLAFNMMGFNSFAPILMDGRSSVYTPLLSAKEFIAFYTTAGMAGSLASAYFFKRIGNYTPSLGASGSIFGLLTYFCLMHPTAGLTVMFVLPMTAQTGLFVGTGINMYLVVRAIQAARMGSTGPTIDGMAHLAGQAVGFLWFHKRRAEEMMELKQRAGGGGGRGGGSVRPPALPPSPPSTARGGGIDI
jgi:membrane associated rhomboid family serine protease